MKRKKYNKMVDRYEDSFIERDENFYFIAGYTSIGIAYGITWEEAMREGLLEENEINLVFEDLPF